jgi:D-glycero-D-manno-heptose 1,7-bisphosphate phosphatase
VIPQFRETCTCRKPKPGMILQASHDLGIDLLQSWMIGDILVDVEAGNQAGCNSILIDNGNETEWILTHSRKPTKVVHTFKEAVRVILETVITDKRNYEWELE